MPISLDRSPSRDSRPPRSHDHVSATVAASGRHDRPAAKAGPESACQTPGKARHKGISDHCRTPSERSCASATHTNSASDLVTSAHARSIPPNVSPAIGAATLYALAILRSAAPSANAARSRTSTGWIDRPGDPGARTRPPTATLLSHHGSRPTYSRGPSTTPGRRIVDRAAPKVRVTRPEEPRAG